MGLQNQIASVLLFEGGHFLSQREKKKNMVFIIYFSVFSHKFAFICSQWFVPMIVKQLTGEREDLIMANDYRRNQTFYWYVVG